MMLGMRQALIVLSLLALTLTSTAQSFDLQNVSPTWSGEPFNLPAADLDGDGLLDVLMYDDVNEAIFFVSPLQPLVAHPVIQLNAIVSGPSHSMGIPRLGDFDGDGRTDIMIVTRSPFGAGALPYLTARIMYQQPGGTLSAPVPVPGFANRFGFFYNFYDVGDFNGDGLSDIYICTDQTADDVILLMATPGGGWAAPQTLPLTWHQFEKPAMGDFNGDGIDDLALDQAFLYGDANSNFTLDMTGGAWNVNNTPHVDRRHIVDLNQDGFEDVVMTLFVPSILQFAVEVHHGGPQPFQVVQQIPLTTPPGANGYAFANPMDCDADGLPDLMIQWKSTSLPGGPSDRVDWVLLRNHGAGAFSPTGVTPLAPWMNAQLGSYSSSFLPQYPGNGTIFGDFDQDGDDDLFHGDVADAPGSIFNPQPQVAAYVRNDAVYGSGCIGTPGAAPQITLASAYPGSPNLTIGVTGANPFSWAILLLAAAPAPPPWNGCALLLDQATLTTPVTYWTGPLGETHVQTSVTNAPWVIGLRFWTQWAVIDPGGAISGYGLNFALTPGRTVTIF